jgi:NAD(P)-dependent dehydrogenase (short-subunit alcohol dehydrogenase family)
MKRRLEDKVAIVVGAGTKGDGIGNGKACAIQFAREGAKVLCVDKDESAAKDTAYAIKAEGGSAEVCTADIVKAEDCEHVIDACIQSFGKLDILQNNVGIALASGDILNTNEEEWQRTFDVNVKGIFLICKAAIPKMIEGGGGSIINVSSVFSVRPGPSVTYNASKAAENSLTLSIAYRYARYNIRANVLLLGYIDTPLARPGWANDKVREINLRQVPMRRFAPAWEVATVAAFLASDEASYVTGVILPVDGGLSLSL